MASCNVVRPLLSVVKNKISTKKEKVHTVKSIKTASNADTIATQIIEQKPIDTAIAKTIINEVQPNDSSTSGALLPADTNTKLIQNGAIADSVFDKINTISNTDSTITFSDTVLTYKTNDTKTKTGDSIIYDRSFDYEKKIRIITINKITKDTIVEWVSPGDLQELENITARHTTKPKTEPRIVVDEEELYKHHASIRYTGNVAARVYELSGDTLFVQAPEATLALLYTALVKQSITKMQDTVSTKPIVVNNKTVRKEKRNDRKEKRQQVREVKFARIDSLRMQHQLEADSIAKVALALEKIQRQKVIDSALVNEIKELPTNDTLIGDAWIDNDPDASLSKDTSLLRTLCDNILPTWQTFKCKAKVRYENDKDDQSFSANLRLIRDSATWASVIVLLEAARVIITPDSSKIMDRLKDKYYVLNNATAQKDLGLPVAAQDIQQLLLGGIPMQGFRQRVAKITANSFGFYAISNGPKATIVFNKDSTLRSVYIRGNNKQGYFTLKCLYDNYEPTEHGPLSTKRQITSFVNGVTTRINLDINKYEFDVPCEVPFEIPKKFKLSEFGK
jgi:Domain of unknown function (DUF4292)